MAKHKRPNYHAWRCENCGKFTKPYGLYLIHVFSRYSKEVCRSCFDKIKDS